MPRWIEPVVLEGEHVVLEPLARSHVEALERAAADGELWRLWYTTVPAPGQTDAYVDAALEMRERDGALPFVVRRRGDGSILAAEWPAVREGLKLRLALRSGERRC